VELEVLMKSQAKKIAKLEAAYTDLKCEKDNVTTSYRRLAEKHNAFTDKAEHERKELTETHTMELARIHGDLNLDTHNYTEYGQNVRHGLRELHETVTSSFDEVKYHTRY
jgi:hypothetical protein